MVGELEEGRSAGGVDAARGPQQGLELARVERRLLREEVEDPAAVVVDDDDPDRRGDLAQGGEAAEVVEQAEVAGDDRRRPAARRAPRRSRRRSRPSMPVGAAVAEEERVGVAARRETPPGRGSACSRRCRRGRRRAWAAPSARCSAGSVDRRPASSSASIASPRRGLGLRSSARRRLAARSPSRAAQPAASSVGSARRIAAARRVGSFQPPLGSTTIWSAPDAASQARSGLLVGISPKRRTRSGTTRSRSCSSRSSRS